MKLSGREQIGTGAKSFAETAKPLFIGSIPIAASNNNLNRHALPSRCRPSTGALPVIACAQRVIASGSLEERRSADSLSERQGFSDTHQEDHWPPSKP